MKKFTLKIKLFLLLLVVGLYVSAQPYTYPEGQQWNVYVNPAAPNIPRCTVIFHSDNEYVQYDGETYKILYCDSDDLVNINYGIYREDNGKVFMRKLNNFQSPQEEFLLYDWNLNIGDEVYVQQGISETGLVLYAVTDTIINGEERRVFHLQYNTDTGLVENWIEGIGSELGFPFSGTKNNPVSPFGYEVTTEMLCYYEDGLLSWNNPDYDECVIDYWVDVPEIFTEKKVVVYPNPTKGNVTITGENLSNIEVFNIVRQTIMSSDCEGNSATINMSVLPAGVYIMRIRTENGHELNERIVKE